MSRGGCVWPSQASLRLSLSAAINQFYQCQRAIWWCLSWPRSAWCRTKEWRRIEVSCLLTSTCSEYQSNFRSSPNSRLGTKVPWNDRSGWHSVVRSRSDPPWTLPLWLRTLAPLISAAILQFYPRWNSCRAAFSRRLCATWWGIFLAAPMHSPPNNLVRRVLLQACPHLLHQGPSLQSSTF